MESFLRIQFQSCISSVRYQKVLFHNLSYFSEDGITEQSTSKKASGKCPDSHPFAYFDGGKYCCQTNYDLRGKRITLDTRSCENNSKIICPHGKCINYSGPIASLLSCYLNKQNAKFQSSLYLFHSWDRTS